MRPMTWLFVVLLAAGVVVAKSEKREVCVFVTGLDERTLGFSLSPDESADIRDLVVGKIERLTKGVGRLSGCSTTSVESAKARHALAVVITIRQFFLTYHSMGQHQGNIHVMLAVFDTLNGYSRPCFTVSTRDTGWQTWGNYKPFRSCFVEALNSLEETFGPARERGKTVTGGSLQDLALSSTTYDCGRNLALGRPEFSEQTVGYTPLDEEIHDFSSEAAYYLEMITGKRVIMVDKGTDDSLTYCAKESARLECFGNNNTFSLSIAPVPSDSGKTFSVSVAMKKASDWNDSVVFSKLIYKAFVEFFKSYKSFKATK